MAIIFPTVNTNIGHPEAITIDFAMDHTLYWADSKLGTINMMDHNGQRRHVVVSGSSLRKPTGLDVFESNMFWVNQADGSVMQQDKFASSYTYWYSGLVQWMYLKSPKNDDKIKKILLL